jgi:hypothetical protein
VRVADVPAQIDSEEALAFTVGVGSTVSASVVVVKQPKPVPLVTV